MTIQSDTEYIKVPDIRTPDDDRVSMILAHACNELEHMPLSVTAHDRVWLAHHIMVLRATLREIRSTIEDIDDDIVWSTHGLNHTVCDRITAVLGDFE